jgi:3-phenylpropionate/trans-cinnamate dioxygenase ferredoxin reductase subunit
MAAHAFTAFYLRGGTIIAADAVNRPAEFMLARRWVAAGVRVDPHVLADLSVELKRLVAA